MQKWAYRSIIGQFGVFSRLFLKKDWFLGGVLTKKGENGAKRRENAQTKEILTACKNRHIGRLSGNLGCF